MSCARLPVFILVFVRLLTGCSRPVAPPATDKSIAPPVTITVAAITSEPLDVTLPVVGTLFARDEATVAAEVEGKLEKTGAEFGDRITAGQPLALIDTDTYAALAQQATARVNQARANAVSADHELGRQQALRTTGIASPADLDAATAGADSAKAAVGAVVAAETVARLNVDRSQIRAPFDGAIADRLISAGDFAQVGTPLFRIVNDSVLKFIVAAPESYAPLISKEQPVRFTVDAFPGRTFEGKVFLISPQITAATRMFSLGALVPNADRTLKAGTFARGEVVLKTGVPTVLAPLTAIVVASGNARVFVVSNQVVRPRPVQLGRVVRDRQEVTGLTAGEQVVTSGHSKLQDGSRVVIRP